MSTIYTKTYEEPKYNVKEVMRYAGAVKPDESALNLFKNMSEELKGKLSYRVCWSEFPVKNNGDSLDLSFAETNSKDLKKNLMTCEKIILFAATIGIYLDRMILKYSKVSPSKALMLQAIGAERIESLCNIFNSDMTEQFKAKEKYTMPRFSPGYGDLDISFQTEIFKALDCPRKIGLSLNKSLLMSPSKSVTAIIGISDRCPAPSAKNCGACKKYDCNFREQTDEH